MIVVSARVDVDSTIVLTVVWLILVLWRVERDVVEVLANVIIPVLVLIELEVVGAEVVVGRVEDTVVDDEDELDTKLFSDKLHKSLLQHLEI